MWGREMQRKRWKEPEVQEKTRMGRRETRGKKWREKDPGMEEGGGIKREGARMYRGEVAWSDYKEGGEMREGRQKKKDEKQTECERWHGECKPCWVNIERKAEGERERQNKWRQETRKECSSYWESFNDNVNKLVFLCSNQLSNQK